MGATRASKVSSHKPAGSGAWDDAEANLAWLADNYEAIRSEFAGSYVVVWHNRVVAHGKNLDAATKAAKKEKIPIELALVEYVPKPGQAFVI